MIWFGATPDEKFGANVRARRKALGWSQAYLRERLAVLGWEVHQVTIARLELGRRPTSVNELVLLSWALDLTLAQLLNGVGS